MRALQEAGVRPLDQASSPRSNAAKDAAVAAPEPLDDPEPNAAGRKSALYGLCARP